MPDLDATAEEVATELALQHPAVREMTYIELGLYLSEHGIELNWLSLSDLHDALGGYENKDKDAAIRQELDARIEALNDLEYHPMEDNTMVPNVWGKAVFESTKRGLILSHSLEVL